MIARDANLDWAAEGASVAPKLLQLPVAEETVHQLSWPPGYAFGIGVLELACLVLYLYPRTNVFGAVNVSAAANPLGASPKMEPGAGGKRDPSPLPRQIGPVENRRAADAVTDSPGPKRHGQVTQSSNRGFHQRGAAADLSRRGDVFRHA
ncbi:MAG: hypothetical protein ABW171_05435 [Steroidobacter sp.]